MGAIWTTEEGYLYTETYSRRRLVCFYCNMGVSKSQPLVTVHSYCKLNSLTMCRSCLGNKKRRWDFSILKDAKGWGSPSSFR